MSENPAHVVAEALAEVQAMLQDHFEYGVGSPVHVLARIAR